MCTRLLDQRRSPQSVPMVCKKEWQDPLPKARKAVGSHGEPRRCCALG